MVLKIMDGMDKWKRQIEEIQLAGKHFFVEQDIETELKRSPKTTPNLTRNRCGAYKCRLKLPDKAFFDSKILYRFVSK